MIKRENKNDYFKKSRDKVHYLKNRDSILLKKDKSYKYQKRPEGYNKEKSIKERSNLSKKYILTLLIDDGRLTRDDVREFQELIDITAALVLLKRQIKLSEREINQSQA